MDHSSPTPTSQASPGLTWMLLRVALIVLAGCWVYAPALHGSWIWDDALYLPRNPLLHDPHRLWKIWFAPGSFIEYYPIEATLQYFQWSLWQDRTLGYHVTNLVLHLLNALLLWRLLAKLGLRYAWVGGLIFAVHPVLVESVAWIAEFKNTLSLAPFLLAMGCWVDYENRHKPRDYWLALGLFLFAMLCKIGMAPFPFVILLYAWWKRGRIGWTDVKGATPFLLISLVMAGMIHLTGIWFRDLHPEPEGVTNSGGLFSRLALAGLSLSFYFWKSIWPSGLLFLYPKWTVDPPQPWQFLPLLAFVSLAWWFWKFRGGWGRHALLGTGFFVLMIGPFLGLNVISYMRFTWVMDHFLYLPIIGLIGLAVAGLGAAEKHLSPRQGRWGAVVVMLILALLAGQGRTCAYAFTSEITLWTRTLEGYPGAWSAHNNLGNAYQQAGQFAEAMGHYRAALRLNPNYADPHTNMAAILLQTGQAPEALKEYGLALRIDPDAPDVHYNLGNAYFQTGRLSDAILQYEEAVRLNPSFTEAYYNLGNALIQTGKIPEAAAAYEKTLALNPDHADAHTNLGNALLQLGQTSEALAQYRESLRINPYDLDVRKNMASVLMQAGRLPEARVEWLEILRLNPVDADAKSNLKQIDAQH